MGKFIFETETMLVTMRVKYSQDDKKQLGFHYLCSPDLYKMRSNIEAAVCTIEWKWASKEVFRTKKSNPKICDKNRCCKLDEHELDQRGARQQQPSRLAPLFAFNFIARKHSPTNKKCSKISSNLRRANRTTNNEPKLPNFSKSTAAARAIHRYVIIGR